MPLSLRGENPFGMDFTPKIDGFKYTARSKNRVYLQTNSSNITWTIDHANEQFSVNTVASPTFTGLTLSSMTAGSVLFAGTAGVISQDNASFFWNINNDRLGIGTSTVNAKIEINTVSAGEVGLIIKGAASQTADFIKIQNSGGSAIFVVGDDGNLDEIRNVAYSFPSSQGASDTFLHNNGSGTLAWNILRLKSYTVATLPAGTTGDIALVTDATAPTYLGALTGGGAVVCPVFYNGTAWLSC